MQVADVKYIASCSFGKDSTVMVLRLIEEKYPLDEVVFYDTGMEFECIYNVRDKIIDILNQHNISYTELKPHNTFLYDMLIHPKTKRKTGLRAYGNEWRGKCRWHTFIKQRICNQYTGTENHVYIGIAQDEPQRLKKLDTFKSSHL